MSAPCYLLMLALLFMLQTGGHLDAQSRHGTAERATSGTTQTEPTSNRVDATLPSPIPTDPPMVAPNAGTQVRIGSELPPASTQLPPSPILLASHLRKPPPDIHAASAILIDASSGQVLFARNADVQRPMASTTKIMTALLFCENVPDNEIVTASKYASTISESSLHLKAGEKLNAHDLLRAILMRSANDACVAAAEHVAGSVPAFAKLMNQRAAELGCKHTHFANPNGLHDRQHYTCARDLALITREALECPRIDEVVRLTHCRIKRSIDKQDLTMHNHSIRFLKAYSGADGVKTGWTIPAGHCFVGSATRKGMRLIAVVLKSPDFVHETAELLDFGFANYTPHLVAQKGAASGTVSVTGGVTPAVPVTLERTLQVPLPYDTDLSAGDVELKLVARPQAAPVTPGTVVGVAQAVWNGQVMATSRLVTTAGDSLAPTPPVSRSAFGFNKSLLWLPSLFGIAVVSLHYYGKYFRRNSEKEHGQKNRQGFAALAKSARRRWRRLAKSLRSSHR